MESRQRSETAKMTQVDAIQDMWEKAAIAFEEICKESLQEGEIRDFADVQKKIEESGQASFGNERKTEDKWKSARDAGLGALNYLKMLVGIASQAATFIPIPAAATSITAAALTRVFEIPQAVRDYNDSIDGVFGEVSSSLAQFRIIQSLSDVDQELVMQIHRVLVSFVKICAYVVKHNQSGTWHRIRKRTKFAILKESDLAAGMSVFKKNLEAQNNVQGTLTLAKIIETEKGVAGILTWCTSFEAIAEETRQMMREQHKSAHASKEDSEIAKSLEKICLGLGIPPTVQMNTNTTQTRTNISDRCAENTGNWIWDTEAFVNWTNPQTPTSHVLVVSGPRYSGKTLVSAHITKRLEEDQIKYGNTYVAHYFFPANMKTSGTFRNTVESALKYMAFQFARVDSTTRKALSPVCHEGPAAFHGSGKNRKLDTLWRQLRIGGSNSTAVYYLVFDGIENLDAEQANMLLEFAFGFYLRREPVKRVRFLVSATEDRFHGRRDINNSLRIHMKERNNYDMQQIIRARLDEPDMLPNPKPGSHQMEARDMIIRTLGQNTNGSYALLQHKLDRVSRQLKMGASFEQLEAALDESSSSCDVAIKDLQQTLPADHISQLNELLKWILFGQDHFTVPQLEAIMWLHSPSRSLITLDRIIENRYSSVLRIDDGYVYAQEGVQEYLEAKNSSSQRARTKDSGTISMTITINNVDPDQCGSFFWDLAELAVRDKFQFSLQGSNQRTIAIDEFRAHHEIVIRAFEYLRSNPKEETKEIGLYLLRRLPYHLGRLYTLDNEDGGRELKRQEKVQIGKHLYETFKDQTIIHRHKSILEQLVWSSSDMASVWEWLKDPAVLRNLDQMWCNEIRATHPPRGFLRELVLMVVQRFLKERTWDVSNASLWIREFMAADDQYNSRRLRALSEKRPKIENVSSESLSELSGSNNIDWDEVGSWCQDILGLTLSGTNSLWYERLAEASSIQGDSLSSTIKLYEKSISQRNPSWLCFKGLGNAYYSQDRHEEAIETIQRALEETEQEGSEPEPNIQDIAELHLILGNCAYECGDIPLAVEHYASACSAEKTNQAFQAHLGHLKAKLRMPDVDIKQLLKTTIGDELEDERNIGVLQMMARDSEDDELMLIILAVAKQDAELLESVIRVLQKAVERLAPLDRHGTETFLTSDTYDAGLIRGVLLYHLGVAIYTHENDAVENHKSVSEAVALWSDSRDQLARLGGSNASIIGSQATSKLAKHYFQENRVEELTKLAEDNSRDYYNHPARLLGALYAQQGNKEESRRWLQRHVQRGLLNLSDDFDDNDLHGLYLIVTAMLQHRDFNNAVVAFSLQSEADLVTAALCFDLEDIEVENEDDKQRVLDVLERLAEETVHATRLRVPDSARQLDRIDAAKEYIECLTGGSSGETKSEGEAKGDPDVATTAAHNLIQTRITDLKASHSPGLSPTAFRSRWCDGRTSDGKGCDKGMTIDRGLYHCTLCWDRDFCEECLTLLRKGRFSVCSPTHEWLFTPPHGADTNAGPKARYCRIPSSVGPIQESDKQVLMAYYDETETDDRRITLEEWKQNIAQEWDVTYEPL